MNIIATTIFMSISNFHVQYVFPVCASIVGVFDKHRLVGKEPSLVTDAKLINIIESTTFIWLYLLALVRIF
jgi:hypothetical protein